MEWGKVGWLHSVSLPTFLKITHSRQQPEPRNRLQIQFQNCFCGKTSQLENLDHSDVINIRTTLTVPNSSVPTPQAGDFNCHSKYFLVTLTPCSQSQHTLPTSHQWQAGG